jgi:uncharacterized protein (TIGR00730 family)
MKSICVFSGSSPGSRPEYAEAAAKLGKELVRRGLRLVYGGADVGLMSTIANTVLSEGGEVTGVIPKSLVEMEVAHNGLTDLQVVGSMHERKALMADLSDGFIAMPGGMGTLEEVCEILTWGQLGLHAKPCGLLDICDYYGDLRRFFLHMVEERFLKQEYEEFVLAADDPVELLDMFEQYKAITVPKWLDRDET